MTSSAYSVWSCIVLIVVFVDAGETFYETLVGGLAALWYDWSPELQNKSQPMERSFGLRSEIQETLGSMAGTCDNPALMLLYCKILTSMVGHAFDEDVCLVIAMLLDTTINVVSYNSQQRALQVAHYTGASGFFQHWEVWLSLAMWR